METWHSYHHIGTFNAHNAILCPYCGYKYDNRRYCCPRCGFSAYELNVSDNFCAKVIPAQTLESTDPYCSIAEPFPGNGQLYNAPPDKLTKPTYGEYIQPWNGYIPEWTRGSNELHKHFPVQTANIKTLIYDGIEVKSNKWMNLACEEARKSVLSAGGPFAGVIVQIDDETNEVIRYWIQYDHVTRKSDPTAHAIVSVIRAACKSLGVINLGSIKRSESRLLQKGLTSHCEIYSAAEPCPMCYSAIYWARIPVLYFAATRYDAAQQGVDFSTEPLYDDIGKPYKDRRMKCYQCTAANSLDAFNLWKRSEKTQY